MKKILSLFSFLPLILWMNGCSMIGELGIVMKIADSIGSSNASMNKSVTTDKGKVISLTFKGVSGLDDGTKSMLKLSSAARLFVQMAAPASYAGYEKLNVRLEGPDSTRETTYRFSDLAKIKDYIALFQKCIDLAPDQKGLTPYCDPGFIPDSVLTDFCTFNKSEAEAYGKVVTQQMLGFEFVTFKDSTRHFPVFCGYYKLERKRDCQSASISLRESDHKLIGYQITGCKQ
ncbi:MAG: hypothetical protein ACHQRM_11880 [Bacteroidia bacterium]